MRFESSGHVVQSVSCEQAAAKRRKPGYGLLFTNLNDAARAQLRHGIQSLVVQRANVSLPPTAAAPTKSAAHDARLPVDSAVVSARPPATPAAAAAISGRPLATSAAGTVNSGRPLATSAAGTVNSARPLANSARPANTQSAKPVPERSPAPATSLSPKPAPERSPAPATSLSPKPPAIDPNEELMLDRLRSELRDTEARTPWAVLGISQGADSAQAKKAFFDASKRYHPHLYARYATPAIKQVVTDLFIAHKRAYTTMLKTAQRAQGMDPGSPRKLNVSKQPGPGNK
jgi:hypothetical protein